jgi:hypothetical protein
MIRALIAFAFFLPPLAGQGTMYLRTPGTRFTTVTAASNQTPIVLSVADASIFSNGDLVCVTEVGGNFAANGHLRAEETRHMARLVSAKVGNSFALLDLTGAPVPGSGNYTGGGRVGKCTAINPPATHGVWFDGPTGPLSLALQSPARRSGANPLYAQLQAAADNLEAQPNVWGRIWGFNVGELGSFTIAAAIRGWADSRAASTNAVLFDFRNPDQLTGTFSVDEVNWPGNTGAPVSSIDDYDLQLAGQMATAYSMTRHLLTQAERDRYNAYHFNDLTWQVGGTDYSSAWVKPPGWTINLSGPYTQDTSKGTVTVSGTNLQGIGTTFLTHLVPGSIVFTPFPSGFAPVRKVLSVQSDTAATLVFSPENVTTPSHYAVGAAWQPNQLGLTYFAGIFPYDWNHGGGNIRYPFSFQWNDATQNLTHVRMLGHFARGVASCVDTFRACLVAQRAYNAWYDRSLPPQLMLTAQGGYNSSSVGYNSWRVTSAFLEIMRIARASAGFDLCAITGSFCADGARSVLALATAGPGRQFLPWAELGAFGWTDQNIRPGFQSMALLPTHPDVRGFLDVWQNSLPVTIATRYAWWAYASYDPSLSTPAAPALAYVGQRNYASECVASWGASACAVIPVRSAASVRSGFAAADTVALVDGSGGACVDHCYESAGGLLTVNRNGKFLAGAGDDGAYYPPPLSAHKTAAIHLNADSNRKTWNSNDTAFVGAPWVFSSPSGSSVFWRSVLTDAYLPGANAAAVERQMIVRTRRTGNSYTITHDYVAQSSPGFPYSYLHLPLNGVGSPSGSSAFSVDRSAGTIATDFGNAGAQFRFFGFEGGAARIDTHNNSNTNYSYPSGGGFTARLRVCLDNGAGACNTSTTAAEWAIVQQINDGGGNDAMPLVLPSVVGAHRILQIQDAAPVVAAFTRAGATADSLSFTTTHAGEAEYFIAGLNPGAYNVSVAGVPVAGSPFTVTSDTGGFIFASTAGLVSIAAGISPMDITTSAPFGAVPGGVVGTPYTLTFSASGGVAPLGALALASGSLPPGLSLSAGVLSGTPTAAGTFVFRLSVADARPVSYGEDFSLIVAPGAGPPPPTVRNVRRGVWR